MKKLLIFIGLIFLMSGFNIAQNPIIKTETKKNLTNGNNNSTENTTVYPKYVKEAHAFVITEPLRDAPVVSDIETATGEFFANAHRNRKINPNIKPIDFSSKAVDPGEQTKQGTIKNSKATTTNFLGLSTGSYPPDCNGEVNENYFFETVNVQYQIFNKTGTSVAGPSNLNTIFNAALTGASCNSGDPIILWDEQAQRWFFAEFSLCLATDYMLIAVSTTSDPTGTWYSWSFDVADMPDYMKFGIWQDGYYMSTNTSSGTDVYVFERDAMLAGYPSARMLAFDNPNRPVTFDGFHAILPLDNDGDWAPAGTPAQFITIADDGQGNPADALYIYELDVDWVTTSNSTFTRTQTLNVNAFTGVFDATDWNNVPQPGTTRQLDGISTVLMYRAQYRNFGTHQTIVCNHTIAESGTEAALRWYELRNTGTGWSLYQQGTYNPGGADGISRWNAGIAMNKVGQIGLAYSVSSATTTYPGIRYTGRTTCAPDNEMDIAETTIWTGAYSQTGANRWGDYTALTVDPADGLTFWNATEYVSNSSDTKGSRVSAFTIDEACAPPTITNVTPTTFFEDKGKQITITGSDLIGCSFVIGGITGTVSSNDGSTAIINFPAGNYSDETLTVSNSSGSDTYTLDVQTRNIIPVDATALANDDTHQTIQSAASGLSAWYGTTSFDAGDLPGAKTIDVYNGTYTESITLNNNLATSATNNLIIQNHAGNSPIVNATGLSNGFNLGAVDYVRLKGFTVYGATSDNIYAQGDNVTISHNKTYGSTDGSGIKIETGTPFTIQNNLAYDNFNYGIHMVSSNNAIIKNNTISENGNSYLGPQTSIYTFSGSVSIPDKTTVNAPITVPDNYTITNVRVLNMNITHTFDADLDISLVHPDATIINLSSDNGSGGDNYVNTNFDDAASTAITTGTAPFTGTFRPEAALSAFDTKASNGTWNLRVYDDANGDEGTITGWQLEITYDVDINIGSGIYIESGTGTSVENNIFVAKSGNNSYYALQSESGVTVSSSYNTYYTTNTNLFDYNGTIGNTGPLGLNENTTNPYLLGSGDYHVQSTAGSYHGGEWPPYTATVGVWTNDLNDSPAIDGGNADTYSNEPANNGGIINQGAFGNTVQASKSVASIPPTITSVTPDNFFADKGKQLTIEGTDLSGATVTLGGITGSVSSNNGTTIVVDFPAGNYSNNTLAVTTSAAPAATWTVTVNTRNEIPVGGGTDFHTTIQSALNGLFSWYGTTSFDSGQLPGAKIIDVYSGTYTETVNPNSTLVTTLTNNLIIKNRAGEAPVIDASGLTNGINIGTLNNVTVSGFTIFGATNDNIYTEGDNNIITLNKVYGSTSGAGITIYTSTGTIVSNNLVYSNNSYGVYFSASDNAILRNNTIANNGFEAKAPPLPAIYEASQFYAQSGTGIIAENNIFYSLAGTYVFAMKTESGVGITSDYNTYFKNNNTYLVRYNGTLYSDLTAWTGNGAGTHDLESNPDFVNLGTDFHIKSIYESYAGGTWPPETEQGGVWTADLTTSPALDAGNPATAYGNEPQGGTAVNQGAYGNTAQASKSSAGVVWNGTTDNNWTNVLNWTPAQIPTTTDDATIPALCLNYPIIDESGDVCNNLIIENGGSASLTTGGSVTTTSSININDGGTFTISDGTISVGTSANCGTSSNVTYNGAAQTIYNWTYGNLIIDLAGIKNISGDAITPTVCNNLIISNTAVLNIPVNKALTVNGTLTNNVGIAGLTMQSDALGDASLILNSSAVNATIERYLGVGVTGSQYHYLSQPVNNASRSIFNIKNFIYWDATMQWGGTSPVIDYTPWKDYTNSNLVNGQGYAYYYYATTISFTGEMNYSDLPVILNRNASGLPDNQGWNLIGNPFTSAIDWDIVAAQPEFTGGEIEGAVYYYDGDDGGTSQDNYKYYVPTVPGTGGTYSVGTSGASRYIPMGQGFFVKTNIDGAVANIIASSRAHNSVAFYKNNETPKNFMRIFVNGNDFSDETVVRFINNTSNDFDANLDARKVFPNSSVSRPMIYTLNNELSRKAAINSIPDEISNKLPLGIKIPSAGTYLFNLEEFNFDSTHVYLNDLLLNKSVFLNDIRTIEFETDIFGEINDRFIISFYKNIVPFLNMSIKDQETYVNDYYLFSMFKNTFTDENTDDILTYTASLANGETLPEWLKFNPAKVTFEGTPTFEQEVEIKITATDLLGAKTSDIFILTVNNSSAISESVKESISVFPNPSNGNFFISVNNKISKYTVEISNVSGQIIYKNNFAGNKTNELNLNSAKGIYFMKIIFEDNTLSFRKIVVK